MKATDGRKIAFQFTPEGNPRVNSRQKAMRELS
jgi:hypothetical protein